MKERNRDLILGAGMGNTLGGVSMSAEVHLDPESLAEVRALPTTDPRRRHLAECARCQATLAAYDAFLESPTSLPERDRAAARTRMRAARASLDDARAVSGARLAAAPRRSRPTWLRWKPAWAAAAAVAVVAVLYVAGTDRSRDPETRLRGEDGSRPTETTARAPEILEISTGPNGDLRLRWRGTPAASGYRVILLDASLAALARYEAGSDTLLTLSANRLPGGDAGQPMYGQIAALRDGEEIATSSILPVVR